MTEKENAVLSDLSSVSFNVLKSFTRRDLPIIAIKISILVLSKRVTNCFYF